MREHRAGRAATLAAAAEGARLLIMHA